MATAEQIQGWLAKNQDKAGSTDFVTMTEELNKLTQPTADNRGARAPAPSAAALPAPSQNPSDSQAYTDLGVPIGSAAEPAATAPGFDRFSAAMNLNGSEDQRTGLQRIQDWYGGKAAPAEAPNTSGLPTLQEKLAVDRDQNPNSVGNLGDRLMTNVLTSIPDNAIGVYNIATRLAKHPEMNVPYLAPQMRAAAGAKEMPADAPWWQRLLEGTASAVGTGGVRGLLPGAAGVVGGETAIAANEMLPEKYQLDPQLVGLVGGFAGGQVPRVVPNAARSAVAALYGGHGRENAAEILNAADRTDTRPTGAMLGDQSVQRLEQILERRPGSGPQIVGAREQARNQFTDAATAVPTAAGATMRDPAQIGAAAQTTAGDALASLVTRNSQRQQSMQDQIGRDTPIPVNSLDRLMTRIAGPTAPQSDLSPRLANPIRDKLGELRDMYPPPDPTAGGQPTQGPPSPQVRQPQFVSWRNDLLNALPGQQPISREAATPITQLARQLYASTAAQQGVPPEQFNATQMRSRLLNDPGGQRSVLSPLAPPSERNPGGTTDASTVYSRLPSLTDPQGIRDVRSAVNAGQGVAAGEPRTNDIFASRINDVLDRTLLKRGESALGPIEYADTIQKKTSPAALNESVGPVGAQTLQDVATLARSFHRPTVSGGASRSLMDIAGNFANGVVMPAVTGAVTHMSGGDPGTTASVMAAAAALQRAIGNPIDRARASMLNSPTAAAAMAGRPTPQTPVTLNDLRSILGGLQGSTPYPQPGQ